MKKIFALIFAVAMIFASSSVFACNGPGEPRCTEGTQTATSYVQFQAVSSDISNSTSLWGHGNDGASAGGAGAAGGSVTNYANAADTTKVVYFGEIRLPKSGPGDWLIGYWQQSNHPSMIDWRMMPSNQNGWDYLGSHKEAIVIPGTAETDAYGKAFSKTTAFTYAVDFGTTSMAGSLVKTEGWALAKGSAEGLGGCPETSTSSVYLTGSIGQNNWAEESGYAGGSFVQGGNGSSASFYGVNSNSDSGNGSANSSAFIAGNAVTGGSTIVSIDATGSTRSINACTVNFANVNVNAQQLNSAVIGSGMVGGVIQNGSVFAGGNAAFQYAGANNGFGSASLAATITTGMNSSTASVSAHSFATAVGTPSGAK